MKQKTNIRILKGIKIGFDMAIIVMSLLLVVFIYLFVSDISTSSFRDRYSILAKITPNEDRVSQDFVITSKNSNTNISYYIKTSEVMIDVRKSFSDHNPLFFKIVLLLGLNLSLFFLIFVFFQASKILKSIIRGLKEERHPLKHFIFNTKNIKRFRYIAYGFIAMPLVELIIYFSDFYFLSTHFITKGFTLTPFIDLGSISWDYFFIGLFFIAFIEIIRRGISIQEENDLTI